MVRARKMKKSLKAIKNRILINPFLKMLWMINHRTDDDCEKEIAIITIYKTTQPVEKYRKALKEEESL